MQFRLTPNERKVLGLPIEKEVTYKGKKPRRHGGRGTPKENKTNSYDDIQNKVNKGFLNVNGYSQYLDKMVGSKYAKTILEAYANTENYTVLTNVLRTENIPGNKKLEIAAMLFHVSSDHIIETMNDSLRKEAIGMPLKELKKKIDLIITTNRENERMIINNTLMERRERRINRILDLRSELYVYNVACNVCTQTWRGRTLEDAIFGIKHETECHYANDKQKVEELRIRYPMEMRPLREIFDHYIIKLPLKAIDNKHMPFMPEDYKLYVLTEEIEDK